MIENTYTNIRGLIIPDAEIALCLTHINKTEQEVLDFLGAYATLPGAFWYFISGLRTQKEWVEYKHDLT